MAKRDLKAYYQDSRVTLYHGDCRKIIPRLKEKYDCIITDPVWPNSARMKGKMKGTSNPGRLLREALESARAVKRVVIHLGCDSDPRFLQAVPARWPFRRVCWLRYARPSYKGRLLNGSDVAYVFGEWTDGKWDSRMLRPGESSTAGEVTETVRDADRRGHPCPRRHTHVKWLTKNHGGYLVLDPFAGSGTTLLAVKENGYKAIGIEIEKKWCDVTVDRLRQYIFEWPEAR